MLFLLCIDELFELLLGWHGLVVVLRFGGVWMIIAIPIDDLVRGGIFILLSPCSIVESADLS